VFLLRFYHTQFDLPCDSVIIKKKTRFFMSDKPSESQQRNNYVFQNMVHKLEIWQPWVGTLFSIAAWIWHWIDHFHFLSLSFFHTSLFPLEFPLSVFRYVSFFLENVPYWNVIHVFSLSLSIYLTLSFENARHWKHYSILTAALLRCLFISWKVRHWNVPIIIFQWSVSLGKLHDY
jgi:hypothetical protein